MPRKSKIPKRGKSSKLTALQRIGASEKLESRYNEAQKELEKFKAKAKYRGVDVPFSIPRKTDFQTTEQIRQTIKHIKGYLKNPVVEIPSNKNRLPFKLIEKETQLVTKVNRSIRNFQDKIRKEKVTINGKQQNETVAEHLDKKARNKDYTHTQQYRTLNEKALKERIRELTKKARKNQQEERNKRAKKSYLKAFKNEGLHRTKEGKALLKKIKELDNTEFMYKLSTELNVAFDFVYDDNLSPTARVDALEKAWDLPEEEK